MDVGYGATRTLPFEEEAPEWRDRLAFDFEVSEGSPVVRGTWIAAGHVVSLIVDGWAWADILRAHPELSEDDIKACVAYVMGDERWEDEDDGRDEEDPPRAAHDGRPQEGGPGPVRGHVPHRGGEVRHPRREAEAEARAEVEAAVSEDRGRPHYVYSHDDEDGSFHSFAWYPEATEACTISVPIGWEFVPEVDSGVVLRDAYGQRLGAMAALVRARARRGGFRATRPRDLEG